MSRPQKDGIDYFPLDVTFFSDTKIKILKARYGVDGVAVYLYFLCEIYRSGYYLRINEDSVYILSDDLKMSPEKVKQVLNFLLERSLFDNTLFQSDKVLTSAGIQRRFQLAVKERAKKNPVEIKGFWLLEESETEPFIQVNPTINNSGNNGSNSRKNADNSREKSLKESKVKESKEKEINTSADSDGKTEEVYRLKLEDGSYYPVYREEIEKYRNLYPSIEVDVEYRKMTGWLEANPAKRKTRHGIQRFINSWLSREVGSRETAASAVSKPVKRGQFFDIPQRDTDYDAMILKGLQEQK